MAIVLDGFVFGVEPEKIEDIVLDGFVFGVTAEIYSDIVLDGFVWPLPLINFSQFRINDHYSHSFVSVEVTSFTLRDLNPNVSLRSPDKTLTFNPGSLIANETFFLFGYDSEALVMDYSLNAEFAAGRIHTITKTNVPVFNTVS